MVSKVGWITGPTQFAIDVKALHEKNTKKIALYAFNYIIALSPIGKTGNYQNSHELNPVDAGYVISSNIIYGRRIEHGWSQQAPFGVYGVAKQATFAKFW